MTLDTVIHRGNQDKPAVVFIHGLGMDKDIWVNPSRSRILGGMFPLTSLLNKKTLLKDPSFADEQTDPFQTLFDDLVLRDYTTITWSQERPASPIDSVVTELKEVVKVAKKMGKNGIVLIGHSRGGLIGRKYLLKKDKSIRSLITISTPHKGSSIAKVAGYLSPLVSVINPFVRGGDKGSFSFSIKRIFDFLKSRALKELLPDSHFFKSLKDGPYDGVYYVSAGGTDPTLFSIYNFSIPDIFEKVIPDNLYPEEIKKGKGDGLVSAESSKIPWANEHYNFPLNHAQILFDKGVRDKLVEAIERNF
ncbi:MAG: alpha/beta hydrolase [Nitrospirota bacterium]|nr:alpha/beta hydrolase [Nitrospirota bacterium]